MSAPTFIAKSSGASASGGAGLGATASLPYMGSIQAGDILFILAAALSSGASIGSISAPAGFTGFGGGSTFNDNVAVVAGNAALFYKIADGTESGNVNVTGFSNLTVEIRAQMYQFRSSTAIRTLIDDTAVKSNGNGAATMVWNALTLTGGGRTLLAFSLQTGGSPGVPSGYTNVANDSISPAILRVDTVEDVSSDGSVSASGGSTAGWFTTHVAIFSPSGKFQIIN